MLRRASRSVALVCLFAVAAAGRAAAQSETGQITIAVVDSGTKTAIGLARVLLDGPILTTEFTDASGRVVFTDVPSGIYRARIAKAQYQTLTTQPFEVLNGKAVSVNASLAKSQALRVIGSVTVHSEAHISSTNISETSAVRRLSDTLTDALGKLSGVTINTDATGDSDATQTISLEGQDPSQTALTVNGIPLGAPGTAVNLNAFASDLFGGASVSFGPQAGALAGGVNFQTLEPTLSWQSKAVGSAGSFGKSSLALSEQGSFGNLGIAMMHTVRGNPNPISGAVYTDASGQTYAHDAGSLTSGNFLKLRYRLGSAQTLTGTIIESDRFQDLNCYQFTGPLPCGYGPGNASFGHSSLISLTDTALVGETAIQAAIFGTDIRSNRDMENRTVNGGTYPVIVPSPAPFGSLSQTQSRGASVNVQLPSGERHSISVQAVTSSSSIQNAPTVASALPFTLFSTASSYTTLSVTDQVRSNTKLRIGSRFGLSTSTTSGNSVIGGVNAQWSPQRNDTFAGSVDVGGQAANVGRTGVWTDPSALRFICDQDVAFGSAPGDQPGATSSVSERATWIHKLKQGQITTALYRQTQNNTILPVLINANALQPPASVNGTPYLANAQMAFAALCGASAPLNNIYFSVPVGGTRRVYEGAQLTAGVQFGRSLIAQPYYDIQVAKAISIDPAYAAFSDIVPGAQLPNVPLHVGGITLDYKAPRSDVEGLLNARYTGANNRQNIPANVVVDAGFNVTPFVHGSLTFAETNVFNTYGGVFATTTNAVPILGANGLVVPAVARPNAPRQFTLTYTLPFGQGVHAPGPARVGAAALGGAAGGQEQRGQGGGRGGFFGGLNPLPQSAPPNPFDVDATRTQCTAGNAKAATAVLNQLKAYVAQIEAAKSVNGYPDTPPAPPSIPGLTIAYRKVGTTYALTLTISTNRELALALARPLLGCAHIHVANAEQAQARGLYAPPSAPFFRRPILFMPSVGLYFVFAPPQAGAATFRLYKLPETPPSAPFVPRSTASCTADLKTQAQPLLAALSDYFAHTPAGALASAPARVPGWQITAHAAKGGTWYELEPDDTTALPTLLNCAHVSAATRDELTPLGFDAVAAPGLNYAEQLGLYLLRPAQQQNGTSRGQ